MDTGVHPELINGRFAYVPVSRASHDAQIFTSDATNLADSLSKQVSKTSALEFGKLQAPLPGVATEKTPFVKNAPATGLALGL